MIDMFLPNMFFAEYGSYCNDEFCKAIRQDRLKKLRRVGVALIIFFSAGIMTTSLLVGFTLSGQCTSFMLTEGLICSLKIAMGLQISILVGALSLVLLIATAIVESKANELAATLPPPSSFTKSYKPSSIKDMPECMEGLLRIQEAE